MKTNHWILLGICLASLSSPGAARAADCKDDSRYPEISLTDLQAKIAAKEAFVVDVNSEKSFKEKHVASAIHFGNPQAFAKALPTDKNQLIVAYCGGPQCAAWKKAAQEACEHGYTNVKHFKGGLAGWKEAGT